MDAKTIVSSRGQIVIPKLIRDLIGLHSGSQLLLHLRSDHVLEVSSVQKDITHFFGQGFDQNCTFFNIDEAIEEAVCENLRP